MIIAFNHNVFQPEYIETLRDILMFLSKGEQHFVETNGLLQNEVFIYETPLFTDYLSMVLISNRLAVISIL